MQQIQRVSSTAPLRQTRAENLFGCIKNGFHHCSECRVEGKIIVMPWLGVGLNSMFFVGGSIGAAFGDQSRGLK